jgi:hypothetical protein
MTMAPHQPRLAHERAPAARSMISPRELALAYDQYAAALWRGDDAEAGAFATWLDGYWADEGPAETPDSPHVVSFLGGAGAGIRWYARGRTIVGYVGNRPRGCYQVPVDAAPPLIAPFAKRDRPRAGAARAAARIDRKPWRTEGTCPAVRWGGTSRTEARSPKRPAGAEVPNITRGAAP